MPPATDERTKSSRKDQRRLAVPKGLVSRLSTIDDPAMRDKVARLGYWFLILTAMSKERRGKSHHWIPIDRDQWKAKFGNDYPKVITAAKDVGVILVNGCYSTGWKGRKAFPKSFRLAKKFHRPLVEEYTLSRKPRSKGNSDRHHNLNEVGRWLANKLDLFSLAEEARPRHVWDGIAAEVIRHQEHYAVRCEYGRFHSIFTATSRTLRKRLFLSLTKSPTQTPTQPPLQITDIRNSQPLILGLAAKTHQWKTNAQENNNKSSNQDTNRKQLTKSNEGQYPYVSTYLIDDGGIQNWLDLCARGRLYEFLAERLAQIIELPTDPAMRRKIVKKAFLPMLFDKLDRMESYPLYHVTQSDFPAIAGYMREAKSNNYQDLARECQRKESSLCIDAACGRLMQIAPEMPILTIHDAIITTQEFMPIVESTIRAVYGEAGTVVSLDTRQLTGH